MVEYAVVESRGISMKGLPDLIKVILVVIVMVMGGCTYSANKYPPAIATGNTLRINQSFEGLANGSQVYFQNGARLPSRQLDKWSVYCALYIYNDQYEADYITSVQPGKFLVSDSVNRREVVGNTVSPFSQPGLLATLEWHRHDPPSYILYRIDMQLYSVEQPGVKRLSCYQKASSYGRYHPNVGQIKQALGDIIQVTNFGE